MRIHPSTLALALLLASCQDAAPANANERAAADKAVEVDNKPAEKEIPEISVEDADKALKSGAVAVDANSKRTREKQGVVPGAVILTSSYKYEMAQLPSDKSKDLIFYCSSTSCTASDSAAERASAHGYDNVHIMREGIKGWKAAGKPTQPYPQS